MSTVDELKKNNSAEELEEMAKEYDLPYAGKNKTELAESIVRFQSGVPQDAADDDDADEDVQDDADATDDDAADEPDVRSVESDDDAADEPVAADEAEDDVLVKFTGKALKFQVGRHFFGRRNPFKVLSADEADALFEGRHGNKFRVASPKEAREFYG